MTARLENAACRTLPDPELMWPASGHRDAVRQARGVCASCPAEVQRECVRQGVALRDWSSIRGGMTGVERLYYYRQRMLSALEPTPAG